jgi:hypothetical protein
MDGNKIGISLKIAIGNCGKTSEHYPNTIRKGYP